MMSPAVRPNWRRPLRSLDQVLAVEIDFRASLRLRVVTRTTLNVFGSS